MLCAMNEKTTICSLGFVVLLAVAGCRPCDPSQKTQSTTRDTGQNECCGIVATIRSLGGTTLSSQGIRLQHTLKNTTDKPIVIHDLENSVIPELEGEWGCVGGGPFGKKPTITLSAGESVPRWVELRIGEPTEEWPFSIQVRFQGTGVRHKFVTKPRPATVRFRVGYDDAIFVGECGDEVAPVLVTPWIAVEVVKK